MDAGPLDADVTDLMDLLDPSASAAIQAAINAGEIKVVVLDVGTFLGIHDYNTIGYAARLPKALIAITILHEYKHLLNVPPPGPQDPSQPSGPSNPINPPYDNRDCLPCHHKRMVMEDIGNYQLLICSEYFDELVGYWDTVLTDGYYVHLREYAKIYEDWCRLVDDCNEIRFHPQCHGVVIAPGPASKHGDNFPCPSRNWLTLAWSLMDCDDARRIALGK